MDKQPAITPTQILTAFRDRDHDVGLDLFKKLYHQGNLPEIAFVKKCFTELNRHGANEEGYELLHLVSTWLPHNAEVAASLELARKIFYDSLVALSGSKIQTARQKAQMFAEHNTGLDTLARNRLEAENKRTIQELFDKALEILERARSLIPDGLPAYTSLLRCYKYLEDEEKTAETQRIIDRLNETGRLPVGSIEDDELPPILSAADLEPATPPLNPEVELKKIGDSLREREFDTALTSVERLLIQEPRLIEAMHFKVRILTEKHLFHPAAQTLRRAFEIDLHNEKTKQLQIDFLETKLKALTHGAEVFLKKGLKLGPSLGRDQFIKAQKLLEQAVVIAPDEISLLDQLYTCYMYLNDEPHAALIRRDILAINPDYVTTIARLRASSLCFLAGFAYDEAPEALEPFRRLRRRLLTRTAGRLFVTWYVRLSPILVETALRLRVPRGLVRCALYPVLAVTRRLLTTP
ncbi:MAG TPA: hypothetical protein PLP29_10550 [Candidatus Ozemobacteraceae bacterium]|nr:hypothetical protein [Candidatus Ozemobacteraceae bacterium]